MAAPVRTRGADDDRRSRRSARVVGLDETRRWWLDRAGDEAGSGGKRPGRLDPARGSHGEESHARRRHGREDLEPIPLDGARAGGMTGAGAQRRCVAAEPSLGHRCRGRRRGAGAFFASSSAPEEVWATTSAVSSSFIGSEQVSKSLPDSRPPGAARLHAAPVPATSRTSASPPLRAACPRARFQRLSAPALELLRLRSS